MTSLPQRLLSHLLSVTVLSSPSSLPLLPPFSLYASVLPVFKLSSIPAQRDHKQLQDSGRTLDFDSFTTPHVLGTQQIPPWIEQTIENKIYFRCPTFVLCLYPQLCSED